MVSTALTSPSRASFLLKLKVILAIVIAYYNKNYLSCYYFPLKSEAACSRREKHRPTWDEVNKCISNSHFRKMFCMSRHCFQILCNKICASIGEPSFKSEAFISSFLDKPNRISYDKSCLMYYAHLVTSGGYISGEVKVAITLRLLAGGDALDLAVIFDISPKRCQSIMKDVLENWIINTNIGKIDIVACL